MIDYQALGQKIRQLRRIENLTQEELAQKLGVSISFVGHLERGTHTASLETLLSLCAVLKTTPNDLLADSLPIKEDAHAHTGLTSEQRKQLKEFLRMAQSALEEWEEWEE